MRQEKQPLLNAAQQAVTAARAEAQNARAETMAAYQARIDAANAAARQAEQSAAQAQRDAERAAAAAGAVAPTPATPTTTSAPAASLSHQTPRAPLNVPGTARTASVLTKVQDGVILRNGAFELRWQRDGNLVVYKDGNQPTWASGTHGRADRLAWQADGNFVIYSGNRAVWATGTADSQQNGQGGTLLRLNRRGHLVVRNAAKAIWRSNAGTEPEEIPTSAAKAELPTPGDPDGEVAALSKSQNGVILKNGSFELRWQDDGNLVVYRNGTQPTWASGTHGRADRLAWQSDGNLVIYSGNRAVWATATADSQRGGRGGQTLTLRVDGVLTIANAGGGVIWSSGR